MADINARFNYESDFSKVTAEIKALVREATTANSVFAQLNKTASAAKMEAARTFSAQAGFAGFKTQIVDLTGSTENFGKALMKNKLTMREYFKEAGQAYKKDSKARALAEREVRRAQSTVVAMGDINGKKKGMLVTPESLDMSSRTNQIKVASKQYEIFNSLISKGSTELVNWGKNTQWAGRQLTVGLSVPMGIFAGSALKAFSDVDKEITRFRKVYGSDLTGTVGDATDVMVGQIQTLGSEFAKQYGIASAQTMALAADLAAAGFEGQKLSNAVTQTTRLMVLGEVDRQEAMKATLSIQTAFNQSSKELAQSVDFLNAVENQTSASLQDLTDAIPKTGPVIQALGGDIKDLSVLMTAMREGGIAAGEGANAIKSGMASLISPTTKAIGVAKQFGIDLQGIVTSNKGELMPMLLEFQDSLKGLDDFGKAKLIEEIFGKYQFARMSALFDNLNQQGSQTIGMVKLLKASSDELAKKSYSELKAQEMAPSTRLASMQQQLQEQLIKVGADIANTLLPIMQSGLDILGKIVDGFNNLPGPIKSFAKILAGVTAAAGPILMLAGIFGNLIGNAMKFGMSIINMFKKITGNPVKELQILSNEELAAKVAAEQLTGAYGKQKTSVDALNKSLQLYIANLRQAASVAPPGAVVPGGRPPRPPVRRAQGGVIYAKNGVDSGGRINGYGGGDTVPAMLEPGEFVINKKSSKKFAPMLRSINDGSYGKHAKGTPNGVGDMYQEDSDSEINLKGLLTTPQGATRDAALAAMSPEARGRLESVIASYNDVEKMHSKFRSFDIPGMGDLSSDDFTAGVGTDRAHFAALQNLVEFDEASTGKKSVALVNDYVISTAADSRGVNRLVADLVGSPENMKKIASAIGMSPEAFQKVIADTRPLIVNGELRDVLSKIGSSLEDRNNPNRKDIADALFQNSKGEFSGNKSAKFFGAMASLEKITPFVGDPKAVRQILTEQIRLSQMQNLSKEEWARVSSSFDGPINEIVDMMASGKPLDESKMEKIKKISEKLTGRKVLSAKESLIIKEALGSENEVKLFTKEEREILAKTPKSEKDKLLSDLKIANRKYFTRNAVSTKEGVRARNVGIVGADLDTSIPLKSKKQTGIRAVAQKVFRRKFAEGGEVLPNGTSMQNGVLHAAGGARVTAGLQILRKSDQKSLLSLREGLFSARRKPNSLSDEEAALLRTQLRKTPHEMMRYRGGLISREELANLQVGSTMSIPGISSFSQRESIAQKFARFHQPGGQYRSAVSEYIPGDPNTGRVGGWKTPPTEELAQAAARENKIKELDRMRWFQQKAKDAEAKLEAARQSGASARDIKDLEQEVKVQKLNYGGMRESMTRRNNTERRYRQNTPVVYRVKSGEGLDYVPIGEQAGAAENWKYAGEQESLFSNPSIRVANISEVDGVTYIDGEMLNAQKFAFGGPVGKWNKPFKQNDPSMPAVKSWIAGEMGDFRKIRILPNLSGTRIKGFRRGVNPSFDKDRLYSVLNTLGIMPEGIAMRRASTLNPGVSTEFSDEQQRRLMKAVREGKFDDVFGMELNQKGLASFSSLDERTGARGRSGVDQFHNMAEPVSMFQNLRQGTGKIEAGIGMKMAGPEGFEQVYFEHTTSGTERGRDISREKVSGLDTRLDELLTYKLDSIIEAVSSDLKTRKIAFHTRGIEPQNRRHGGVIYAANGKKLPGYGGGDKVPAMLEPGEFVINKESTKKYGNVIDAINRNQLPGFQDGGQVDGRTGVRGSAENMYRMGQGAVGLAGNLAFLPSTIEMAKTAEGWTGVLTKSVAGVQAFTAAIQIAGAASMALAKIQQAQATGGLLNSIPGMGKMGGLVKASKAANLAKATALGRGATAARAAESGALAGKFAGGGKMATSLAGKAAGKGILSGLARGALMGARFLPVVGVAVMALTAGVAAFEYWQSKAREWAEGVADAYGEATEMAKVYNIELKKTGQALDEQRKAAKSLGVGKLVVGKGSVEKDYEAAVTKDYGKSIERVKGMSTEAEQVNELRIAYASLITQGFSQDQAKEITAEIARQATATGAFNATINDLTTNVRDAKSAMNVMTEAFSLQIEKLGTAEEKVAAFGGAYNNLLRQAADNPIQFAIEVENLVAAGAKGGQLKSSIEDILRGTMGLGEDSEMFKTFFANVGNLGTEEGQKSAQLFLRAIAQGFTASDLTLEYTVLERKVQIVEAAEESKILQNKDMQKFIDNTNVQINAQNKLSDEKIIGIEKGRAAAQEAHEEAMQGIDDENQRLQERADIIGENADYYIKMLEKEYKAEEYYQGQRASAAGGLEALAKGDIFGYLDAQMQAASDAEQFGREQAIAQIEDTRDAAVNAIQKQIDANNKAKEGMDQAFGDQMQGFDDKIEEVNTKRSNAVKGMKELIDMAQAFIDKAPGDATANDLQKIEDKAKLVAENTTKSIGAAITASSSGLVEGFRGNVNKAINAIIAQTGMKKEDANSLLTALLSEFSGTTYVADPNKRGMPQQTKDILPSFANGETLAYGNQNGQSATSYYTPPGGYTPYTGTSFMPATSSPVQYNYKNKGGIIHRFNRGSLVPGSGNTDTVPAMLTPGEFVMNKKATAANLSTLQQMNSGGKIRGYNNGGMVGGMPSLAFQNGGMVPNYSMPAKSGGVNASSKQSYETETNSTSINMPVNIVINGTNLTANDVKNDIYREMTRARKSMENTLGGRS